MPELLRRVAALTLISTVGISLLAPLSARSALPELVEAQRLLEVADAPVAILARDDLSARSGAQLSSAQTSGIPAEAIAETNAPVPPAAPMEATLYVIPRRAPAPAPAVQAAGAASTSAAPLDGSVWDQLAQCESGGNWAINTGNGYYGGLQFSYGTWLGYGGGEFAEYAHQATREQQIIIAERLHAARGFQPWPACRRKLGLP